MRLTFFLFSFFLSVSVYAQILTTEPAFPKADQPVKIRIDVTGTSLDGLAWDPSTNPVWVWAWIDQGCPSNCDAPTNVNPATGGQDAAKALRVSTNPDIYEFTFTPTTFFNKPASQIKRVGIKLKTRDWADNKQTDNNRYFDISEGFALAVSSPSTFPIFKNQNEQISIIANTSEPANLTVKVNGAQVASASAATTIAYDHTVTESAGQGLVEINASNGTETKSFSFYYIIRTATANATRPAGIKDGINYYANDHNKVTLSLLAPGKTSVYVVGDFTNWQVQSAFQMKRDGEHFWLTIQNLTPGQEYAYQYLIDETIRTADPYADKILDPDDQYISQTIYPNLKTFPSEARTERSWLDRAAVLQTNQSAYAWQASDYVAPAKEDMVIYELLIRDFFASSDRSYQNLIDTVSYFKRLGVNAVQLMPVMEFNGNESWGYNPTFMFAPDKAYGPKNKLKEFIDKCHQEGIAVILDIAMNHQDIQNPYVLMDFDFAANALKPSNKWFNVTAKHPYNVFFDMNHESEYTKAYLDTVTHYWLNEYRVDGFRFDLSKGFTQNERCAGSTTNEGCFFQKDDSRIAILKRMGDEIWKHTPDAILILEHFAEDSEEIILSDHGFLLWGNLNHSYNQNTLGYSAESDFSRIYFKNRGWSKPNLVGYMESHDEERMMYKNLTQGSTLGDYSAKNIETALTRMRAANALFYTIPGPKMIWQFGEFGYDQSINRCVNGSVNNNCRLDNKPVLWNYYSDPSRKKLWDQKRDLLRLRNTYNVFTEGDVSLYGMTSLVKQATLKSQPYTPAPQNVDEMNVHIVANFDLVYRDIDVSFPHAGTWYEYYRNGDAIEITSEVTTMQLPAGRVKIFTDVKIENEFTEDEYEVVTSAEVPYARIIKVYPNPVVDYVTISGDHALESVKLFTSTGGPVEIDNIYQGTIDMRAVPSGLYVLQIIGRQFVHHYKIVKK